jgi:hypothetical protein
VTTEAFVGLARTEAAAFGMPDVRLIPIPHPLSGATREDVERYAAVAVDAIARLFGGSHG